MKKKSAITLVILFLVACFVALIVVFTIRENAKGQDELYVFEKIEGQEAYSVRGDETLTFSKHTKLVIPAEHEGLPVVRVQARAFAGWKWLREIVIPDSVQSIGGQAFALCENIKSITFGNALEKVGGYAFYGCAEIERLSFKGSIADWCAIEFAPNDGYGFDSNPIAVAVNPLVQNVQFYIQDQLVTDLVIPDGVTEIKSGVFYGYDRLTSVIIPDSVQSIGDCAFASCSNLESVSLGNGISYIGREPFTNCNKLQYHSDGVLDYLGNEDNPYVYLNKCKDEQVESVTVQPSTKIIGSEAFRSCGLTSIQIPEGVLQIGYFAFFGCIGLGEVVLPDSLKVVEDGVFYGCYNLTKVCIPDGVTALGKSAFQGCSFLTEIILPKSVTAVGDYAFSECDFLEKVYYTGTADEWGSLNIGRENDDLRGAKMYYYSQSAPSQNDGTSVAGNKYWHYVNGKITPWTVGDLAVVFIIDMAATVGQDAVAHYVEAISESISLLEDSDKVGIFTGNNGVILPITSCVDKQAIASALERIQGVGVSLSYNHAIQTAGELLAECDDMKNLHIIMLSGGYASHPLSGMVQFVQENYEQNAITFSYVFVYQPKYDSILNPITEAVDSGHGAMYWTERGETEEFLNILTLEYGRVKASEG